MGPSGVHSGNGDEIDIRVSTVLERELSEDSMMNRMLFMIYCCCYDCCGPCVLQIPWRAY